MENSFLFRVDPSIAVKIEIVYLVFHENRRKTSEI